MRFSKFAVGVVLFLLVGLSSSNYYRSQRPRPQQNRWTRPQQHYRRQQHHQQQQQQLQPDYRTYHQHHPDSQRGQIRERDVEDQGRILFCKNGR